MKLEIVTEDGAQESMVRSFVHRKVLFALERWNVKANGVVRLDADAATWMGRCCFCVIDLHLSPSRRLHISAYGESAYDCVLRGIQKLERVLAHEQQEGLHGNGVRTAPDVWEKPFSLTEY